MLLRLKWQQFFLYQAKESFVCYSRKHYRNLNSLRPRQVMGRRVITNVKDPWGAILWCMQCSVPLDTTVKHLKIHCGGSNDMPTMDPHLAAYLARYWGTRFLFRTPPRKCIGAPAWGPSKGQGLILRTPAFDPYVALPSHRNSSVTSPHKPGES